MAPKRNLFELFGIFIRGMAMGAADVVPGVSGGTIAFITGIYEEFIESIKSVNLQALKVWRKEGIGAMWRHINGNFLVALIAGIGCSIVLLASRITWMLENHPILLWSFFFGLVLASVFLIGKTLKKWDIGVVIALIIGAAGAYWITILPPATNSDSMWYIMMAGSIAICAMILPGISGSFILVLMGAYATILGAIDDRNWQILAFFAVGCIIGIVLFSRLLSWLFKRFHDITIGVLIGFLIGSLNKIWPWKEVKDIVTIERKNGEIVEKIIDGNVLPQNYDGDPQLLWAIILFVAGLAVIFVLDKVANMKKRTV